MGVSFENSVSRYSESSIDLRAVLTLTAIRRLISNRQN